MKIEEIKISDLKPYENNARTHSKSQIELLKRNIIRFGFTVPCLIDKNNVLIAGHGRVIAVKELGWETVPCIRIENLSDDEIKALRLADNQLGLLSDWNIELVKNELIGLGPDTELLDLTGFSRDLIIEGNENDDLIPENATPVAKLGDIWILGKHKIMCGDSCKKDDVARLMGDKKADMVFTDPPYGMNLDTDYSKLPGTHSKYSKVIGDDVEFDISFLFDILPSPVYYIWGADYLYNTIPNFKKGSMVVWAKRQSEEENKVFGSAYELCWVYPKIKKEIWFIRAINQSSERLGAHPTQKPTELGTRAIKDRTQPDDIVADLFLGSGSTLIACEKTNRICYGMELDEHYVSIICQRFFDYTGIEPIRQDGKKWSELQ